MKEFGLLKQDANEEEADILGAPMMIPFADQPQPLVETKDLQFDDILKGMGLHDDVADILEDKSEEEEEKKIDSSCTSKNAKITNSLMRNNKQGNRVGKQTGKTF